ncbi:hypothetical protein ACFY0N_00375 [Streptomyces vinaceus]|uniref:hypothetical protein n=1 Tax=Streptomyces vinaceus TaxID=1960 RepID=UPI0036AF4495
MDAAMSAGSGYNPPDNPCPGQPMTRAAILALRTAGQLRVDCHYVVSDGPVIGTAGNTSPTQIELHALSPTELATEAKVHTAYDNSAWSGIFDIDLGTAGSIIRLTDASNNTVEDKDADSPTVHGMFPWHLPPVTPNFRDNLISDMALPNWASIAVGDTVQDNVIRGAAAGGTLDLGGTGTVTIQRCEIIGTTTITRTGTCNINWSNSKIASVTMTLNGGGTGVTITDSILLSGTITRAAASVSLTTITQSLLLLTFITLNGTGGLFISASETRLAQINLNAGSARGITVTNSSVQGTINQNRTLAGANDFLSSSHLVGSSVLTWAGAAGSAGSPSVDASFIDHGSTVTITDPGGAIIIRRCRIENASVVNCPGIGNNLLNCRVAAGMTLNPGAFQHSNSIFELPGATKTLTAANVGRLCNKAFDDTL